ncbi:MAG: thiamine-phosphate kinase [Bdellovibrio sp.]|nr:thiamine-phosphate kinase [Bdellovibrio sp.]
MKLKELGEFGLIEKINKKFSLNLPRNVIGIGDDCAVINQKDGHSLLVTTDLLIENVHFLKNNIHPKDLGYKSLAVNLSDIAAMGGTPQFAFLSVAMPTKLDTRWIADFCSGFYELANTENVFLLGGDTTKSKSDIMISAVILGKAKTTHIKKRSDAKLGDIICVTDFLGDSAAGLKVILNKYEKNKNALRLIKKHYRPKPHLREGQWLAQHSSVHAMMDISDGIDSDIRRIMKMSHCGAEMTIENIPISPTLKHFCKTHALDPISYALAGGEDYCLLFTAKPSSYQKLNQDFEAKCHHSLYKVGKIVNAKADLIYLQNGKPYKPKIHGYDHFI